MITRVLALTCAVVFVLHPTSGIPADRNEHGDYLKDEISYSEMDYIFNTQRFSRRANKEENSGSTESDDDYPEEEIRQLILANSSLSAFFQKKKVPNFGNRHNSVDLSQDTSMCLSNFGTTYPRKEKNRKGILRNIVNIEGSYQPVYQESCKRNAVCALRESFPLEYTSKCKQKYSIVSLMVYETSETILRDEFDIPCGCVCAIKMKKE